MKTKWVLTLLAVVALAGPAMAIPLTIGDPNEAEITDGYDIKSITFDDSSMTDLAVIWELYDSVQIVPLSPTGAQVQYIVWFNIPGFDQNPLASILDPAGNEFDFSLRWHGQPQVSGNPAVYSWDLYGENALAGPIASGSVMPAGNILQIDVPWTTLVDTFANQAYPVLPPASWVVVNFFAQLENGDASPPQGEPDDISFTASAIPEPMTMLAIGLGVAGLAGYSRRRNG